MHQRTSHPSAARSSTLASARHLLGLTSLSAVACLAGCNGDALNLGEDTPGADPVQESTCSVDPSSVSVFAGTQAEVDALAGCRELPGNLFIDVPEEGGEGLSLAPLAELEAVHGVLSIVGPLTSLGGLEALELVAGLHLSALEVSDLTPLRGLTTIIREPTYARLSGTLRIEACDRLTDLSGLENVTVWSSVILSRLDGLTTLAGLHVPPRAEEVSIGPAPQLSDASALASLEEVAALSLFGTAITNVAGFQLETAEYLSLGGNPALTDLDGFSELQIVGDLQIAGNSALQRIDLPRLEDFDSISISGNTVLRVVPLYLTSRYGDYLQARFGGTQAAFMRPSRLMFQVSENPQLTSIVLPATFYDIEQVAIYGNASLTSLDMANLQQADTLWIGDNPVLASVDAAALQRVADLAVMNNPALSVAPFADVQTFTRELTGNLDEPAP